MLFADAARRRRMVRSFLDRPVDPSSIRSIIEIAQRAPSAGNTASLHYLVLDDPEAVGRYWATTLPDERRSTFPWPGLLRAPVLIIPCCSAAAYVDRYAESDKVSTGLGSSAAVWDVPYWYIDGGAAVMLLLLAVVDAGLGALFFGQFSHTDAVQAAFGIPDDFRPLGTIAVGHPAGEDRASTSTDRPKPTLDAVIHRSRWTA